VEAGDTVILIPPGYGRLIWEHIPMRGLTDGATARRIPATAMLPTQPILMVMALMGMAEDLAGAEDLAEEDGSKPQ
jgi:hypothetical protein